MNDHLIHFEALDWESSHRGVEQKVFTIGKRRLRLVRFRDTFLEEEWCLKGHVGFVVEGEMKIDFNGVIQEFKKGDGLWIEEGGASRHKVIMEKGKEVELILFESVY